MKDDNIVAVVAMARLLDQAVERHEEQERQACFEYNGLYNRIDILEGDKLDLQDQIRNLQHQLDLLTKGMTAMQRSATPGASMSEDHSRSIKLNDFMFSLLHGNCVTLENVCEYMNSEGRSLWDNGSGKIKLIKRMRELTQCGLLEAKLFVEGWFANAPAEVPVCESCPNDIPPYHTETEDDGF
jgi:hypothetical protein